MKLQNNKNSNLLDIEVKNYGECGWCVDEDNRGTLDIPWEIWSRWLFLSQQMRDKEWGGVFWVKDGTIDEFKIPVQQVTSVNCEFEEELGGNGIVHSHHNMDAFHSPEDDAHARNVYEYSIVLSNKGTYEATKKTKLPCGAFGYVKLRLNLLGCPSDIDFSKITEEKEELFSEVKKRKKLREETIFSEEEDFCGLCYPEECRCGYLLDIDRDLPPEGMM